MKQSLKGPGAECWGGWLGVKHTKTLFARPFIRLHKAWWLIDFLSFLVYQQGSVITLLHVLCRAVFS
jgi:hypothetical protein